ncbi:hypothetical protein [Microbacterium karelineae]|uniref:hypothetical protein n=1 Tax=Microbacterium karelineae TaxID=2654283 RepID=UPI0012EA7CCC|nr:hypothetical protein [Microbacterium karelineae]
MPSPAYVLNALALAIGAVGGWACALHFGHGVVGTIAFVAAIVAIVETWRIRRRRNGAGPAVVVLAITTVLVVVGVLAAKGAIPAALVWAGAAGFVVSWAYVLAIRIRWGIGSDAEASSDRPRGLG